MLWGIEFLNLKVEQQFAEYPRNSQILYQGNFHTRQCVFISMKKTSQSKMLQFLEMKNEIKSKRINFS